MAVVLPSVPMPDVVLAADVHRMVDVGDDVFGRGWPDSSGTA